MRTEAQVIAFLEEANPVQDLVVIEESRSEASAFMVSLGRGRDESQSERRVPSPPIRLGLVFALTVVVIVAVSVFLLFNRDPDIAEPDPATVVDQFVSAQDFDTLSGVLTPDALRGYRDQSELASANSFNKDLINQEMAAHKILGIEYAVESCTASTEVIIRCDVSYQSNIRRAFGEPPLVQTHTFYVENGLITVGSENFGMGFDAYGSSAASAFLIFVQEMALGYELQAACPSFRDLIPDCANFIMDLLDDFVAWGESAGISLD